MSAHSRLVSSSAGRNAGLIHSPLLELDLALKESKTEIETWKKENEMQEMVKEGERGEQTKGRPSAKVVEEREAATDAETETEVETY